MIVTMIPLFMFPVTSFMLHGDLLWYFVCDCVPCFLFHEGHEPTASQAFQQIATLTRGAYCRFDSTSAAQLKGLLAAVAVYAAGGRKALSDFSKGKTAPILRIAHQMDAKPP